MHPIIELTIMSVARFKFANYTYLPFRDKIDLATAQKIIVLVSGSGLVYGGQEGSSLRKRLNLSKSSRFTSTVRTMQPLYNWCSGDIRFTGGNSIREFIQKETKHLETTNPYLYTILQKPTNPADKKKFSWGSIMNEKPSEEFLSNTKTLNPSLLDEVESYLTVRCNEFFDVPTPSPTRPSNFMMAQFEEIKFDLDNYSYEVRRKELIIKRLMRLLNLFKPGLYPALRLDTFGKEHASRKELVFYTLQTGDGRLLSMLDRINGSCEIEYSVHRKFIPGLVYDMIDTFYTEILFFNVATNFLNSSKEKEELRTCDLFCLIVGTFQTSNYERKEVLNEHSSLKLFFKLIKKKTNAKEFYEFVSLKERDLEILSYLSETPIEFSRKKVMQRFKSEKTCISEYNFSDQNNKSEVLIKERKVKIGISDTYYCLN